jgi:hypothetical protein
MSSVAIQLTQPNGDAVNGILMEDPKVGSDCRVYLGADRIYCISRVKGWLGQIGGGYFILFDKHGSRFKMAIIARSGDFL